MKSLTNKLLISILSVLVVALGVFAIDLSRDNPASAAAPLYDQNTVTSIYNAVSPSVVEIDVTQGTSGFYGRMMEGQGSGFFIDSNGYILTNNHVVEGAKAVSVIMQNGTRLTATVVGTDTNNDLAIIKVDPTKTGNVTPLTFADSSILIPGQMAIAIGCPYGLDQTITVGVISGTNRTVETGTMTGMIQTDAALNPGNSGGPLLDANGKVIGINTAIQTSDLGGAADGIGYAVPSNVAVRVIPLLQQGKQLAKPWLGIGGIALSALTPEQLASLNLSVTQGVYVANVYTDSPAEKAGLKAGSVDANGNPTAGGDIITAADGKAYTNVPDLSNYLSTKNVGDVVTLTVVRGTQTVTLKATLAAWPSQMPSTTNPQVTPPVPTTTRTTPTTTRTTPTTAARPWLGVTTVTLTAASCQSLGIPTTQGVYIIEVAANSPAATTGLKAGATDSAGNLTAGGDVITSVDGHAVANNSTLSAYLLTKKVGDTVTLSILRNGQSQNVQVKLGTWPG
jgi:S1-C subfamily serine protease